MWQLLAQTLCGPVAAGEDKVLWGDPCCALEFKYLAETSSGAEETWAELDAAGQQARLEAAHAPAGARYEQLLAYYNDAMQKWDMPRLTQYMRNTGSEAARTVGFWLGAEKGETFREKMDSLKHLLQKAQANTLTQEDFNVLGRHLTPEAVTALKSLGPGGAAGGGKPPAGPKEPRSAAGLKTLAAKNAAPSAPDLSKFYDGSNSPGGGAVAPTNLPAAAGAGTPLQPKARGSGFSSIKHAKPGIPDGNPGAPTEPQPVNCWDASGYAKTVCGIHVGVWSKYRQHSLGPGSVPGSIGNAAVADKHTANELKDEAGLLRKLIMPASAGVNSALALIVRSGTDAAELAGITTWRNEKLPSAGAITVPDIKHDKYMRCYDWQEAISAAGKLNGVKTVVTAQGGLVMQEVNQSGHSYVVFRTRSEIYISDPWKNGKTVLVVPDTPENRKKWTQSQWRP